MKDKLIPDFSNRKSAYIKAEKYDVGYINNGDYIEVTEWTNRDGIDVEFNRNSPAGKNMGGSIIIKMTYGELNAIKLCCKRISKS